MQQAQNNLKKWLPPLIKLNFLNIKTFCKEMGINRSMYYKYANDTMRPSVATVLKMAKVLQCSPKEILEQVTPRKRFWGKKVF